MCTRKAAIRDESALVKRAWAQPSVGREGAGGGKDRRGTFAGDTVGLGARISRRRGKHRTEVTEVTEGGLAVGAGNFGRGHRWPGCKNHAKREKHRTEVTEVTEGGLRLGAGSFGRRHRWLGCENLAKRESIAQRPRRSQRGDLGVGRETLAGDIVGPGARITPRRGKHRTEVTEVTEGDWGRRGKLWPGTSSARVRESREEGESIAQRSRRSQRGIAVGRETLAGDIVGLVRESREEGKSIAQRPRRSQRGIAVGRETLAGDTVGLGARISRQGKGSMISPLRVAAARMARIESQALRAFRNSCRCPPNNINARPEFPLCDLVTSVRCFPLFASFLHESRGVHQTVFNADPIPPSVTSVASVRCFPLFTSFPPGSRGVHQTVFQRPTQFPPL